MYIEYGPLTGWRIVKTKTGLKYAARVVKSNQAKDLTKLKISLPMGEHDGHHIFENMGALMERFFYAMAENTTVKFLDLSDCAINDKVMTSYVTKMLRKNTTITSLNLKRNNLTEDGADALFEVLSSQAREGHPLISLNLSTNQRMVAKTANGLTKYKFTFCDLEKFSLENCTQFGAPGVSKLVELAPQAEKVLTSLNLTGVNLGDDGAASLAKLLDVGGMSKLKELLVVDCGIRELGVKELCSKLQEFPIRKLDLTKNHVGDGGLKFLADFVTNNATLKSLQLKLCEFSQIKFVEFLDALYYAYENVGTSMLEEINLSKNGLGDGTVKEIKKIIKHPRCLITKINYDGNEMTDDGAIIWAEILRDQVLQIANDGNRRNRKRNGVDIDLYTPSEDALKGLTTLTLKDNQMTHEGITKIASVLVVGAHNLHHLDIRKNSVGLEGARALKKAFLGDQRHRNQLDFLANKQFELAVYPEDVGGPAGINEIMVGMRTASYLKLLSSRYAMQQWIEPNPPYEVQEECRQFLDIEDPTVGHTWKRDKGYVREYMIAFKRIHVPRKYLPFVMSAHTETKLENLLDPIYEPVFLRTFQDELIWNPEIWKSVKKGYVAHVAEALYRHAIYFKLLEGRVNDQNHKVEKSRFHLICADDIKRLSSGKLMLSKTNHLMSFWEKVIKQKSPDSEGLTMLEFCLKYGKGTLVDVLRQFAYIYPTRAVTFSMNQTQPFAFARLGHSSLSTTVQKACIECSDPAVRRWGGEKRLIQNRFAILEYVYKSRSYIIAKVEDLFNTEDEPEDRVFYVKEYNRYTAEEESGKEVSAEAKNEGDAYVMIEAALEKRLSAEGNVEAADLLKEKDFETGEFKDAESRRVEDMVLFRENSTRNVLPYRATIPALPPPQNNARVLVYKPFVKTLRQALDDEGLAAGLDLGRVQHIGMNIVFGLLALNCPGEWMKRLKHKDFQDLTDDDYKSRRRIHGNLKPRNVVLRDLGEVGDARGSEEVEKWVVMDFGRSIRHEENIDFSLYTNSAYMPPEIARRVMTWDTNVSQDLAASEKIDSWGYGCILYEMLAGVPLFQMEHREDWILNKHERAELCNWVRLDEERIKLILPGITEEDEEAEKDMDIQEKYKLAQERKAKAHAINLVSWCLNGDPALRPAITEIRDHEFNKLSFKQGVYVPKAKALRDFLAEAKVTGKEKKVEPHNHVHLANCNFFEANAFMRTLEEYLHGVGCRLTTDMVGVGNDIKTVRKNCANARILLCLLSKDCFNTPEVIKQLFWGNREYLERCADDSFHLNSNVKSIVFVSLDSNTGVNAFDRAQFEKWGLTDGFGFLTAALAKDSDFVDVLRAGSTYNGETSTVRDELLNKYHAKFRAMLRNTLRYRSISYLNDALFDELLRRSNLQGIAMTAGYEPTKLSKKNFPLQLKTSLKLDLEHQAKKPKAAFFMPEKIDKREYPHRVMILEGRGIREWVNESISEIAASMQSYLQEVKHKDDIAYHLDKPVELVSPFTKVLNSKKVKKMTPSHLPAYPRVTFFDKIRDKFFAEEVEHGRLIVVAVVDTGFYKKFGNLLEEFQEKRGAELHIIPVYLDMGGGTWKKEHELMMKEFKSPELKRKFAKEIFVPYFKKADNVEHLACLKRINKYAEALTNLEKPDDQELLIVE